MSLNGLAAAETAINPVEMLRVRLGIDEAEARDLAGIEVACPVPGAGRQSSLGEFLVSEHGADQAANILDIATEAKVNGATSEDAIARALGFAAIRDKETGRLARVVREAPPVGRLEPKKKLI